MVNPGIYFIGLNFRVVFFGDLLLERWVGGSYTAAWFFGLY
jgi:hypothetical protein